MDSVNGQLIDIFYTVYQLRRQRYNRHCFRIGSSPFSPSGGIWSRLELNMSMCTTAARLFLRAGYHQNISSNIDPLKRFLTFNFQNEKALTDWGKSCLVLVSVNVIMCQTCLYAIQIFASTHCIYLCASIANICAKTIAKHLQNICDIVPKCPSLRNQPSSPVFSSIPTLQGLREVPSWTIQQHFCISIKL